MFTGIIETTAAVMQSVREGSNTHFKFDSNITAALKIDQSVSHNGVCLTVTRVEESGYWVTAIDETLRRSSLGRLVVGDVVNLERCMVNNGRFDGHIVQDYPEWHQSV